MVSLVRFAGPGREDLAEAAVQDAFVNAQVRWALDGQPASPVGWLRTVARNIIISQLRREGRNVPYDVATPSTPEDDATLAGEWDDELLRIVVTVCDPRLTPDEQVAFALRVLCSLEIHSIAAIFATSEAVIRKRLSRARAKLVSDAQAPPAQQSQDRLEPVVRVLYALFTEGHKARSGDTALRADLVADAMQLAAVLRRQWPGDPRQADALLALMKLTAARIPARVGADGRLIPLAQQDRALWDQRLITEGLSHLAATAGGDTIEPLQLEAAIAACHAMAACYDDTDWHRVVDCYDRLYALKADLVVRVPRAMAVAALHGPAAGLKALGRAVAKSHLPYWAARGDLLERAGQLVEARSAYLRAAELAVLATDVAWFNARLAGVTDLA